MKQYKYNFIKSVKCRNKSQKDRIYAFKCSVKEGCGYACLSCRMRYFRNNVIVISLDKLKKEYDPTVFEQSIEIPVPSNLYEGSQVVVCKTCHSELKKGSRPKLNYFNGLQLDSVPVELQNMSDIEQVLISKDILFIKLWKLPKSRMTAITDRVVNVPITDDDIIRTVSQLPRLPSDAGIIAVDFKRKTDMKSSVLKEFINVHRLGPALVKLKELGHPGYKFVTINAEYLDSIEKASSNSDVEIHSDTAMSPDNLEHLSDESIRKHQFDFSSSLCFTHTRPETLVISNTSKSTMRKKVHANSKTSFIIAPGQSKIPTSLMKEKDWDINAFPCLHPTGRFGLNYPRDKKNICSAIYSAKIA